MTRPYRLGAFALLAALIAVVHGASILQAQAASPTENCDSLRQLGPDQPLTWFGKPAGPSHLIIPRAGKPRDWSENKLVTVSFLVDTLGTNITDSIRISGTTDEKYLKRLGKSLKGYQFHPAIRSGCRLAYRFIQTFGYEKGAL